MYQNARIIWFDKLKGIGEAQSIKTGKTIFINSLNMKKPEESFFLNENAIIFCQTNKNDKNGMYGTKIKLISK